MQPVSREVEVSAEGCGATAGEFQKRTVSRAFPTAAEFYFVFTGNSVVKWALWRSGRYGVRGHLNFFTSPDRAVKASYVCKFYLSQSEILAEGCAQGFLEILQVRFSMLRISSAEHFECLSVRAKKLILLWAHCSRLFAHNSSAFYAALYAVPMFEPLSLAICFLLRHFWKRICTRFRGCCIIRSRQGTQIEKPFLLKSMGRASCATRCCFDHYWVHIYCCGRAGKFRECLFIGVSVCKHVVCMSFCAYLHLSTDVIL